LSGQSRSFRYTAGLAKLAASGGAAVEPFFRL
jgi:hypothetical protein